MPYIVFIGNEWVGFKDGSRVVLIVLDKAKQRILVTDRTGQLLRIYDVLKQRKFTMSVAADNNKELLCLRVKGYIDLVSCAAYTLYRLINISLLSMICCSTQKRIFFTCTFFISQDWPKYFIQDMRATVVE